MCGNSICSYNDNVSIVISAITERTKEAMDEAPKTRYAYISAQEDKAPQLVSSTDGQRWESVRSSDFGRVMADLLAAAYPDHPADYGIIRASTSLLQRLDSSGSKWEVLVTTAEKERAYAEIFARLPRKLKYSK